MEPITAEKGGFLPGKLLLPNDLRFCCYARRAVQQNIRVVSTNGPSVSLSGPRLRRLFIGQLYKHSAVSFHLPNVRPLIHSVVSPPDAEINIVFTSVQRRPLAPFSRHFLLTLFAPSVRARAPTLAKHQILYTFTFIYRPD